MFYMFLLRSLFQLSLLKRLGNAAIAVVTNAGGVWQRRLTAFAFMSRWPICLFDGAFQSLLDNINAPEKVGIWDLQPGTLEVVGEGFPRDSEQVRSHSEVVTFTYQNRPIRRRSPDMGLQAKSRGFTPFASTDVRGGIVQNNGGHVKETRESKDESAF